MNKLTKFFKKTFEGSIRTFKEYPATIFSALGVLFVTVLMIGINNSKSFSYETVNLFPLICLLLAFMIGVIVSLSAIAFAHSKFNTMKAFYIANSVGLLSIFISFALLYFFGSTPGEDYKYLTMLSIARVIVVILVSYLMFIVFSAGDKTDSESKGIFKKDIPKSFFMSMKAFFVALIYGIVLSMGMSIIIAAINGLLFPTMSSVVYTYLLAIIGFISFVIFVGYFPDLKKDANDPERKIAEEQPRFIQVLFSSISIPLMIAFSVVLILWIIRQTITVVDTTFEQISAITTIFVMYGILVYIMVDSHENKLATLYKKIYPIVSLLLLIFQARNLIVQINSSGIQLAEYWFILLWIGTVTVSLLLIFLKSKAYVLSTIIVSTLAIVSVMPYVGYNDVSVRSQVNRLEKLLISENILQNNKIVPATVRPSEEVEEKIIDATYFLRARENAKLPSWFDKDKFYSSDAYEVYGFIEVKEKKDTYDVINIGSSFNAIDISEYDIDISHRAQGYINVQNPITTTGKLGEYEIFWEASNSYKSRVFKVKLNNEIIISQEMDEYIDKIGSKYQNLLGKIQANLEDMSLVLESDKVKVLLVFDNLSINKYKLNSDNDTYSIDIDSIYIKEKK